MRTQSVKFAVLSFFLIMWGCSNGSDRGVIDQTSPEVPEAPMVPQPPAATPASLANWTGNATVVSVVRGTNPPCGWGTTPNETRTGVLWRITANADAISLDEDMRNSPTDDVPYSGHLAGTQFTATYTSASDYAQFVCEFREAAITGTFTSDSTFDATETLIWGRPGTETTVQRHWTGSRL